MQIPVKEVEKRMIIDDGTDKAIIDEVWPDQGPGLGIVLNGQLIKDGSKYQRRFMNTETLVDCTGRNL
jgi:hypothetical protein